MSDFTTHITTREEMILEENKRFNSERQILLTLAPEKWEELKNAFTGECERVSLRSHCMQIECDEPDEYLFQVNRIVSGGHGIAALTFRFDPTIPRIVWQDLWNKKLKMTIDLPLVGSNVFFANGKSGIVLSQFVCQRMIDITR